MCVHAMELVRGHQESIQNLGRMAAGARNCLEKASVACNQIGKILGKCSGILVYSLVCCGGRMRSEVVFVPRRDSQKG